MEKTGWLWDALHDLFDRDGGSLAEIHIRYSRSESTATGYAFIRSLSRGYSPEGGYFFSINQNRECPVDSVPNAARLVIEGGAQPFHTMMHGVQIRGTTVPDLGVFVTPDELALDYRMGAPWGPAEVEALFRLLGKLTVLDKRAELYLEVGATPEMMDRFDNAWAKWRAANLA